MVVRQRESCISARKRRWAGAGTGRADGPRPPASRPGGPAAAGAARSAPWCPTRPATTPRRGLVQRRQPAQGRRQDPCDIRAVPGGGPVPHLGPDPVQRSQGVVEPAVSQRPGGAAARQRHRRVEGRSAHGLVVEGVEGQGAESGFGGQALEGQGCAFDPRGSTTAPGRAPERGALAPHRAEAPGGPRALARLLERRPRTACDEKRG
jgi:hypothetical protein